MLLGEVEHPAELFTMSSEAIQKMDGFGAALANEIVGFDDWEQVDAILNKTKQTGALLIGFGDEDYPHLLQQIYDPPIVLWVKGNTSVLSTDSVSMVGTRRATQYGQEQAQHFAAQLVAEQFTIVSGLALGIDGVSHKTAIKEGGKTVAVLGSGIDVIYPYSHSGLARDIVESGGAVVSEFEPGTQPDAGNFPERNRIVSGLSLGTLVVESGLKGGSMITAQSTLEQNREVFVIPHSLENVNGIGCNHLIKRGAGKLVQQVEDMLEELPVFYQQELNLDDEPEQDERHWKELDLDDTAISICELLEEKEMHIDVMGEALAMPTHQLSSKLLELEMQDCIRQKAGKNFELK